MPVAMQSLIGGEGYTAAAMMKKLQAGLRVALPGIIQSFNPDTVTCEVQPALRGQRTTSDGKTVSVALPLLVDVPVVFPRGGGCTLTFPVGKGDECLVVFADRCIDFWWQNGGVQETVDPRMHDLSDAIAIVGPMSQREKIGAISQDSAQLRTDDGAAFIEIATDGAITMTSPQVTINGPLQVNGEIHSTGDQVAGGISQMTHKHGGVQSGGGTTGGPQ